MRLVGSGLRLVHDAAVEQVDRSIGVLRVARIVRHHAHRRAAAVQRPQQVHHRLAVTGVEIPRWLVGEQDRRVTHDRAGDRDSLLLAPGELHRVMLRAMHHADPLERLLHAFGALPARHAAIGERQLHILGDGEVADQIEGLEHETDPPVADSGALGRRQVGHRLVLEQVAPVARRIEQTEDGEERRLAAPGGTIDRDVLAFADLEVHVRQRVRLDLVGEEDLADTLQLNERRTITGHWFSPGDYESGLYSYRRATIGSTRAARREGMMLAATVTPSSSSATNPKTSGSCGDSWNNSGPSHCPPASAITTPITIPTVAILSPSLSTSLTRSFCWAPRAARTPSSCERCATL